MRLPPPRGPLSTLVLAVLAGDAPAADQLGALADSAAAVARPCADADLQLALAACYELHYQGFDDADEHLEWDPGLLGLRRVLERRFEEDLRRLCPPGETRPPDDLEDRASIAAALCRLVETDSGPPLSSYLMREATLDQFREFVVQRSVYHLKEADPHTWAVPRLRGSAKAALVEIQSDEYGGGRPGRAHCEMFAVTMRALGLDDTYGANWDVASGPTLATSNLMSLFDLHRRHRGALVGQLAALEMTSTTPNRRYANGLRRLGLGSDATAYYDEHVEADAVHEQLAAVDLCGSYVRDEPDPSRAAADVLWGASCGLALDAAAATELLAGWGVRGEQRCA